MKNKGCTCDICRKACEYRPGWFKPGEAEKVAEFLKMPLQKLFETKLGVDWWNDEPNIFLLAPALIHGCTGSEYPANPKGQCIFYNKDKLCDIHPVKPFECRMAHHDVSENGRHREVADSWETEKAQEQIVILLGREPEVVYPDNPFEPLFW